MIPVLCAELVFCSPWHLWYCFPSSRAMNPTSSLRDSPCPTSATSLSPSPSKSVSGRDCSFWNDEHDFKACLLAVPYLFLCTLRINPVYLLNRKLALSLLLPGAWVSDLSSTYYLGRGPPPCGTDLSKELSLKWPSCHCPSPKLCRSHCHPFPPCLLLDTDWIISPTWFMWWFVVSFMLSYKFLSLFRPKSPISSCISLFFHFSHVWSGHLSCSSHEVQRWYSWLQSPSFLLRHFNNFVSLSLSCHCWDVLRRWG